MLLTVMMPIFNWLERFIYFVTFILQKLLRLW